MSMPTKFNVSLSQYVCVEPGCTTTYLLYVGALASLLLIAVGLVIVCKLANVQRRRRRRGFVRHTNVRGSIRSKSGSLGGSYIVRTQDQSVQLPVTQSRFEYVDLLAETPMTQHAQSEDNLAIGLEQRNTISLELLIQDDDGFYDEPQVSRERTRSISQVTRTVSIPDPQHSSTAMQRGASARASTRSMPGDIINSSLGVGQRRRAMSYATSDFTRSAQQRQSVRSMHDPLPDVPTGSHEHQSLVPADSVTAEPETVVVSILKSSTPTILSSQLPLPRQPVNRASCSPSEKQFSFEDGSLLQSDIPPHLDPAITGENFDEAVNQVSIYSSQILTSVEDTEEEQGVAACLPQEDTYESSSAGEGNTETELYDRLDRSLNPSGKKSVSFGIDQERSQPEGSALYSQLSMESSGSSQDSDRVFEEQVEVLYDTPVVVISKALEDDERNASLKDLFDDPGYTKGMMAARLASEKVNTPAYQLPPEDHEMTNTDINEAASSVSMEAMDMRAVQVNPTVEPSVNSLGLLEYQEDELVDMDPDIVSCLMTTEDVDQQISYV